MPESESEGESETVRERGKEGRKEKANHEQKVFEGTEWRSRVFFFSLLKETPSLVRGGGELSKCGLIIDGHALK